MDVYPSNKGATALKLARNTFQTIPNNFFFGTTFVFGLLSMSEIRRTSFLSGFEGRLHVLANIFVALDALILSSVRLKLITNTCSNNTNVRV